jgi:steroid 5-alpha reductase family enzyme
MPWLPAAAVAMGLLGLMVCAWLTQRAVGNVGWIDVFWTFGVGAAAAILALTPVDGAIRPRQWLVAALAAIWSIRLGAYMAARVAGSSGEDRRYVDLRLKWGPDFQRRLLPFVLLQAPVGWLLAMAVSLAARAPWPDFTPFDALGALILVLAIGGEALADEQMRRFKASAPAAGAINDRGLWAWSRHPNYFFEWLGWTAYPVILLAHPAVYGWGWAAWGAPVLMYLVLDRGTGVPPLEAAMLQSRGDAFRDYQRRTSRFFLWPPRHPSA